MQASSSDHLVLQCIRIAEFVSRTHIRFDWSDVETTALTVCLQICSTSAGYYHST